ncbi:hypothetical protein DICSQDRAFT_63657, partial [Dichomitus squalens LYAD-421 SS1]
HKLITDGPHVIVRRPSYIASAVIAARNIIVMTMAGRGTRKRDCEARLRGSCWGIRCWRSGSTLHETCFVEPMVRRGC